MKGSYILCLPMNQDLDQGQGWPTYGKCAMWTLRGVCSVAMYFWKTKNYTLFSLLLLKHRASMFLTLQRTQGGQTYSAWFVPVRKQRKAKNNGQDASAGYSTNWHILAYQRKSYWWSKWPSRAEITILRKIIHKDIPAQVIPEGRQRGRAAQ